MKILLVEDDLEISKLLAECRNSRRNDVIH